MKVLLTSDLHVGVRKKNGVLFINFAIDYLNYIKNYCLDNDIKHIFFLGDILEKSSSVKHEYFVLLFKKLKEIISSGIEITSILGNHDIYSIKNDSLVETFPGRIIKHQEHIMLDNKDINLLSYTERKIEDLTGDYLFTHLPIEDFKMNEGYVPDNKFYKADLFKDFDGVFSGHYHASQNKKNVVYLGSPFQLNFSEKNDNEKGFIVLDLKNNDWELKEYKNGPKFREINYNKLGSIKTLKNTFIKVISDKDDLDFHKIKLDLYKKGALSVELDFILQSAEEEENENVLKLESNLSDTVKKYLNSFNQKDIDNKKLLDIFDKVLVEMGE